MLCPAQVALRAFKPTGRAAEKQVWRAFRCGAPPPAQCKLQLRLQEVAWLASRREAPDHLEHALKMQPPRVVAPLRGDDKKRDPAEARALARRPRPFALAAVRGRCGTPQAQLGATVGAGRARAGARRADAPNTSRMRSNTDRSTSRPFQPNVSDHSVFSSPGTGGGAFV